ncbi:hypothetical protein KP509_37G050700 [Ceratopteris richardii]|uniref:TOD1/MUCI70 glycosyltransferase-like domain-containing protein n=1 Tax=Ceratopteris richardii TaxID=49495 RepID=A0A8T2Q8S2_CERRI|nr:hypothetical protein KP509_37G050700 [Ceratopteris richardii]
MASYAQGGSCYAASLRSQDHGIGDQKKGAGNGAPDGRHFSRFSVEAQFGGRNALKSHLRGKRSARGAFRSGPRIGVVAFLVLCIVSITIFGGDYLFSLVRNHADFAATQDDSSLLSFWSRKNKLGGSMTGYWDKEDFTDSDEDRAFQFSTTDLKNEELLNRDSRYWDRDDRTRDYDSDYKDAAAENHAGEQRKGGNSQTVKSKRMDNTRKHEKLIDNGDVSNSLILHEFDWSADDKMNKIDLSKDPINGNGGLYNERGRKELRVYEEQLEAASNQETHLSEGNHTLDFFANHKQGSPNGPKSMHKQTIGTYSASIGNVTRLSNTKVDKHEYLYLEDERDDEYADAMSDLDQSEGVYHMKTEGKDLLNGNKSAETNMSMEIKNANYLEIRRGPLDYNLSSGDANTSLKLKADVYNHESSSDVREDSWIQRPNQRSKRHHRSGPCDIKFLRTTKGLREPETNSRFENFTLSYVEFEHSPGVAGWEPRFAGHQTLSQRKESFKAKDQTLHCGFVQAAAYPNNTGFDLAEDDIRYMHTCRIVVSSCIFGNSDNVRSPRNRKLTGSFKKDVCFVMFVDRPTLDVMEQEGQHIDENGFLGPWKIVLVRNMPYPDARRVGKIPKFLTHRLFPAARYSIWLDSKLRLQINPILILEYFLWRGGHEYAISNHYDRHCVWEEVQQNKRLNKYNHTAIDEQFAFYRADGLTRFNATDRKKLLPSNVPEGSFIIRAHTPMSNLFSCLWFNEVDRFTSRDQLSFAYTYMKFVRTNPSKHFYFSMFKDCERKNIAKLYRHRKST